MVYPDFLPQPPPECRDPDLFRLLNEYHFVRWHPDHETRHEELRDQITSESIVSRAELAVMDLSESLRSYAGDMLIRVRREQAAPYVLKLLNDESDFVRKETARTLALIRIDACAPRLIELATTDCSPSVRAGAAAGLGGQDPTLTVPVLIQLLDNDHEKCETGQTPSSAAATALDEMMKTEWTQKRHEGGLRSLNPTGTDLVALREQALLFLEHRKQTRLRRS